MNPPTTPDDYAPYLQELGRANLPYFIEGGQAVNALAESFFKMLQLIAPACFRHLIRSVQKWN